MSENPKAANDERERIKNEAPGQYSHLGTTNEEARLLEAATGGKAGKGAKSDAKPLQEVAVDQGTRLHNFQSDDSVAADLQKEYGEGTFEEGEPGSTVPEALQAQGVAPEIARGEVSGRVQSEAQRVQREANAQRSTAPTGPTGSKAKSPSGPTGATGATGPTGAASAIKTRSRT